MLESSTNSVNKGINKDVDPNLLSKENPTFVLNAVRGSSKGDANSYQSEPGTTICYSLPKGYKVIGNVNGQGNESFILISNNQFSEIGIVKDCVYTTVVTTECLGFKTNQPITGIEFRIIRGCERKIYWGDGVNPDYQFNFDQIEAYRTNNAWDCDKFKDDQEATIPNINLVSVNDFGGNIDSGLYYFSIDILDASLNIVNTSYVSPGTPIYRKAVSGLYTDIHGSSHIDHISAENGGVPTTNKSITLSIENVDTRYDYVRINVISASTSDGDTIQAHRVGTLLPIGGEDSLKYTYTGFDVSAGDFLIDASELLIKNINYRSEVNEQVQNRLVKGNLIEEVRDFSDYQKFASKIGGIYTTKKVGKDIVANGNPKSPETFWDMSAMPDEVAAMGIVYVHADGKESPVCHIPGTSKTKNPLTCNELPITGNGAETYSCIKITYNFNNNPNINNPPTSYVLNYTVDGVPKTYSGTVTPNLSIPTTNFTIECENGVTLQVIELLVSHTGATGFVYAEVVTTTSGGGSPTIPPATTGWHSSLISGCDIDAAHLLVDSTNCAAEFFERHRVFNTAIRLDDTTGLFAYYECQNSDYTNNSCLVDFWGVDICGDALTGTPIRHFKYPDRTLEPADDGTFLNLLGIQFFNVEYPNADVIGHYFVKAERTEQNKTVLDTGILGNMYEDDDYLAFTYFQKDTSDIVNTDKYFLITPKILYERHSLQGCYLKVDNEKVLTSLIREGKEIDGAGAAWAETDTDILVRTIFYENGSINASINNIKIEDSIYLKPLTKDQYNNKTLINLSQTNPVNFITGNRVLAINGQNIYRVSVKICKDVYCDLYNLTYIRTHTGVLTNTQDNIVYGGDTFVTSFNIANTLLYRISDGFADNLFNIVIIAVTAAATIATAGLFLAAGSAILAAVTIAAASAAAVGIQAEAVAGILESTKEGRFDDILNDTSFNGSLNALEGPPDNSDFIAYANVYMHGIYIDSEIDTALRNVGSGECNNILVYKGEGVRDYFINKIVVYDEETGAFSPKPILCPEFYFYNKDYSRGNRDNKYFPLPITHDYCSDCINYFPNRIAWSNVSLENDLADSYLIFQGNNFIDLPAHRGAITGIKYKNNQVFVHTEETTFRLQPNPQIIKTDQNTAYLGTGAFLGVPPNEIIQTDLGHAGSQSKLAYSNTEYGYIWVDQKRGKIFNYTQSLDNIAITGLGTWFVENLPAVLDSFIPDDINILEDHGVRTTYDPYYERLIVTKKDFKPLKRISTDFSLNTITFKEDGLIVFNKPGTAEVIKLTDSEHFENKSWTLSYSFKNKSWTSWHSYLPYYLYNDNDAFYTTCGSIVHKHLTEGDYHTFYGGKYPFIIEFVENGLRTKDLHNIYWVGDPREYDAVHKSWILHTEETFNKVLVYNHDETSGPVKAIFHNPYTNPYDNIVMNAEDASISYVNDTYKLSGVQDFATANPVSSSSWENIKDFFNTECSGYMDLVPINYNQQKSWELIKEINSTYYKVRLTYEPSTKDVKQIVNLSLTSNFNSIR